VTVSALGERAAYAALYWARRRDAAAIRTVVAGLDDAAKATAAALLRSEELEDLTDGELLERMLGLAAKSRGTEHKILDGAERKSMTTIAAAPVTDTGDFTGYIAAFAKDLQGDTIMGPAAVADTVAALNSGAIQWHLTDAHSDLASDVVATVTSAAVDPRGVRIQANWMPTETAQRLRKMVTAAAKLGLSIDYLVGASRPDPSGGRYLDKISICGGACTPKPMNSLATIIEGKSGAWAPVTDIYTDAQARHADPDRDRRQREDELLRSVSWPPPGMFDRDTSLSLIRRSSEMKARRELAGDPERAREQAIRDQDNAYSNGLAATMARLRAR
jgi:hypothetical protein